MSQPINLIRRGDAIDASEFRTMIESNSFELYRARLQQMLVSECKRLEVAELDEIKKVQGAISMLRTILDLPSRMHKSMTITS